MSTGEGSKYAQIARVSQAFTPSAAIDSTRLFVERNEQVMACIDALFQKGLHIGLYGERGVGKTSLARVLPEIVKGTNLPNLDGVRIDCNTTDDYASLWRKIFRDLGENPNGDDKASPDPEDIRYRLQGLGRRTLIVIDELDRLEDNLALSLLADTVKTLSDHAVDSTLMFVGVADSLEHLMGEHASIVRSLIQIHMPRMNEEELRAILHAGFGMVEIAAEQDASTKIVRLSEGLPHYTHLLGLHAGQSAIMDDRDTVTLGDVDRAEAKAVGSHSMLSEYRQATQSPQKGHLFEQVLLACAFAPKNEFGHFRPADVSEPLSRIMAKKMSIPRFARHLKEFCSDHRGNVLYKEGQPRHYIYRFRDPLMQPFVKMVGRTKDVMSEVLRKELQAAQDAGAPPVLTGLTSESGLPF